MGSHDLSIRGTVAVLIAIGLGPPLGVSGCAGKLPPVAIQGNRSDIHLLVGEWTGKYVNDNSLEPGGSISFRLREGEQQAYGDVLMTRRGARRPFERVDPDRSARRFISPAQSLSIRFVRTLDGVLTGELDPYWDFERECQAVTVFLGFIEGNVIQGTYETSYRGPFARQRGTWRVTRSASSRPR